MSATEKAKAAFDLFEKIVAERIAVGDDEAHARRVAHAQAVSSIYGGQS